MKSSRIRLAVVVLLLLVFGGMVHGDVGPGPIDEKFPAMRFDNLADYPDFDFYLLYFHGRGNPFISPHLTRVQSGESIRHFEGSGRNGGAFLLAVPHGKPLPPQVREYDQLHKISSDSLFIGFLEGTRVRPDYLIPYRVKFADGELEVMMQPIELQPAEPRPGASSMNLRNVMPWILMSFAFCVVLAWLGLRVARRLF